MPSENDNGIRLEDGGWFNKDTSKVWFSPNGQEELFRTKKGGWVLCESSSPLKGSSYQKIEALDCYTEITRSRLEHLT